MEMLSHTTHVLLYEVLDQPITGLGVMLSEQEMCHKPQLPLAEHLADEAVGTEAHHEPTGRGVTHRLRHEEAEITVPCHHVVFKLHVEMSSPKGVEHEERVVQILLRPPFKPLSGLLPVL